MEAEDIGFQMPTPCLSRIDTALHRLGMLATTTDSRRDYLKEVNSQKPYLNMVQINTRYVSNVSIGFRVRHATPHLRYKPYVIRERHRTRSENNDTEPDSALMKAATVVDDVVESSLELSQLKKAKSLESIVAETDSEKVIDLKSIQIPHCAELEIVSNSIQNLKVVE